jgi:hypothetical protein
VAERRDARPRWWLLAACCLAIAGAAHAEPHQLNASVVWTRADLIYVAAPDSGELSNGMTLWVLHGKRELASATVTQLLEPHLALARLVSGSLANEKHLEKLHVRGEAPAFVRVALLRVGLPGRGRTNLLFSCAAAGVSAKLGADEYGVVSLGLGAYRLAHVATSEPSFAPDTLIVRLFTDAADEEIALERDELDVAVFWPGELSARLRGDERWRGAARGVRARGVLAGLAGSSDTLALPLAELANVNRELFGGDLVAWSELESAASSAAESAPARWTADAALPGARVIERVLARSGAGTSARPVRLAYLDVPIAAGDAAAATWRTRGVTPVFAVGCPVLATPAARASVARLGADAFANLVTCAGGTP